MEEMKKVTDGVIDVIVYPNAADKTRNRGFAFVEYESHRAAAMARRKLLPGRIQLWNHQIAVDWAEPEQEVDDDIMSRVFLCVVRLTTSGGSFPPDGNFRVSWGSGTTDLLIQSIGINCHILNAVRYPYVTYIRP